MNNYNKELKRKIPLPEFLLNEFLERAFRHGNTIEDMFLIVPVLENEEGEASLDTKYGKLKVFFSNELHKFQSYAGRKTPQARALLLSHKKYPYPKVSKTSDRAFRDLNGHKSHIIN